LVSLDVARAATLGLRIYERSGDSSGRLGVSDPSVLRVGAVCDIDNQRSARLLERAGFEREGVLRSWAVHPNISAIPRDWYSYSKIRNA